MTGSSGHTGPARLRRVTSAAFRLADVRLPQALVDPAVSLPVVGAGLVAADLAIENGRIVTLEPPRPTRPAEVVVPCGGGMVWPATFELHAHLDNAQTWVRAPNPSGSWQDALLAVEQDRERHWTLDDLTLRMDFALRCAFAHGVRAVRTHLDSLEGQRHLSWDAFAAIRQRWAGRVDLQGVSLVRPHRYAGAGGVELADLVARHGGLLGGILVDDPDPFDAVERIFALARERNLDIDLHVDETDDPRSNGLDTVAAAAVRHGWEGRVTVGHCCSLAVRDPAAAAATIGRVARAGLTVVSLPMCNLYLQDRRPVGETPRWRGITLLHELKAAGVPVALGSDDTRDAYFPFGDLDPVEVYVQAVRVGQLDGAVDAWLAALTTVPAKAMGFSPPSLHPGAAADLIAFDARDWWELAARPGGQRAVIRAGRVVTESVPDFRELDVLRR